MVTTMSSSTIMSSMVISRVSSMISVRRRIAEFALNFVEFIFDDAQHQLFASQYFLVPGDVLEQRVVFIYDFFPFQAGQALQAHIQNGLGLNVGKLKAIPSSASLASGGDLETANQRHHLVQMVQGDFQVLPEYGPALRLFSAQTGSAG